MAESSGDIKQEPWLAAMLALAREVWVLRDRQRMLENLLSQRGLLAADAVDRYQPTSEAQTQIDKDCEAFVAGLVAHLHKNRA